MSATCSAELLSCDAFLSEHLARDVRKLDVKAFVDASRHDPQAIRSLFQGISAPAMVYAKLPSEVVPDVQPMLRSCGFELVDTAVTLERPRLAEQSTGLVGHVMRAARAADEAAIARLATDALTTSRFHRDRMLTGKEASRIKAAWVRSYFAGTRGDALIVAQRNESETIDGFLLALRASDGAMVIDLVAVDAVARRQGLCRAMVIAAQERFPKATTLRVGTQGSNIDSLRAYRNIGFTVMRTEAVMHAHLLEAGAHTRGHCHEHR